MIYDREFYDRHFNIKRFYEPLSQVLDSTSSTPFNNAEHRRYEAMKEAGVLPSQLYEE